MLSTEVDGERVILDPEGGLYFSLNPMGNHIWTFIERPVEVDQIVDELLAHYEVDPEHCRMSVIQLLKELNEFSLIDIREDGEP